MSIFKLAKERPVADFLNINELCECGKVHTLTTSILYCYAGAIEKIDETLKNICPFEKVLLLTQDSVKYVADEVRDKISSKNVSWKVLPDEIEVNVENLLQNESIDEDVKCVLAVGSGTVCDFAKNMAKKGDVPLLIVPTALSFTSIFSSKIEVWDKFLLKNVDAKSPDGIIVDLDIIADSPNSLKAAGFGLAMADYLTVFDVYIRKIYTNEHLCHSLIDALIVAVENLCQLANKKNNHNKADLEKYVNNFLKLSAVKELLGMPIRSGVDNLYIAMELIEKARNVVSKSQKREYGAKIFELFIRTTKVYKLFFSSSLLDGLPPDMDYRCEILTNDLKIPEELSYRITSNVVSPAFYSRLRKKTVEERIYFREGIESVDGKLPLMIEGFNNLYQKDGATYLKEDLYKGLIASTEINGVFTAFTVMKYNGVLERYE